MLKSLRVRGFKSLVDVSLDLSPLTVLFGPNAVGKSNLLEAVLLLARLGTERTLADALESPLRGYPAEAFSLPESGLPGLLESPSATMCLEAVVQPPGARAEALRYRVELEISPRSGSLAVTDEYLARLKRDGSPKQRPRIELVRDHLQVRRLGEAGQPRQEPIRLNHTQLSNLQYSGDQRYPDFDRLRTELAGWRMYYLDPREAMRSPEPPRETGDIGPRGELLSPFLYRLKANSDHAEYFRAITRALRATIPTVDELDVELDTKRGTLDILLRQSGAVYSSRVISEGTLRILALCAIAGNPWPSTLVAFEEPENGVHPRRIEVIADLLVSIVANGPRQVLVTTHSPTLVGALVKRQRDLKGLISLFACAQEQRATSLKSFDTSGPLFEDPEIRHALADPEDDESLVQAALLRGWL